MRHAQGASPDPAFRTLYARPLAVTFASLGGAATSAGAGMEPPAAMARAPPCAAKPEATMPPTSTRRISALAPLAATRSGAVVRALVRIVRIGGARSAARAGERRRHAMREGAHTPRLSRETDMVGECRRFGDFQRKDPPAPLRALAVVTRRRSHPPGAPRPSQWPPSTSSARS